MNITLSQRAKDALYWPAVLQPAAILYIITVTGALTSANGWVVTLVAISLFVPFVLYLAQGVIYLLWIADRRQHARSVLPFWLVAVAPYALPLVLTAAAVAVIGFVVIFAASAYFDNFKPTASPLGTH